MVVKIRYVIQESNQGCLLTQSDTAEISMPPHAFLSLPVPSMERKSKNGAIVH